MTLLGRTIAITRPLDQAQTLANMIQQAGGLPMLFPLIAIQPLTAHDILNHSLSDLPETDWAIFISSNAVQYGLGHYQCTFGSLPPGLRYAAIGPTTAEALRQFGVAHTLIPELRFDTEALLALPEMHAMAGKRIKIFRGVGGREVLAETLSKRGASVSFAECYRRINPQTSLFALYDAWRAGQLQAIVVTSSEAMRYLLALAEALAPDLPAADQHWLQNIRLVVNHARVGECAQAIGLEVTVAPSGGDSAMCDCLQQLDSPS